MARVRLLTGRPYRSKNLTCVGWKQRGVEIESPPGYNFTDYLIGFPDKYVKDRIYYLGPDKDGIEPIFEVPDELVGEGHKQLR